MGQNARSRGVHHAWISIDVLLLTIAVALTLFCIGAFIRIGSEPQTVPHPNGLVMLDSGDTLLAFQDFSFDADGWSHPTISDQIGGLGSVLGPFGNEDVVRTFSVPNDVSNVEITFDVNLHGEWGVSDAFTVSFGELEVLELVIAAVTDDHVALGIDVVDQAGLEVHIEQTRIDVRPDESALADAGDDTILNLRMILSVQPTSDTLTLGYAADANDGAIWTLDNLAVVARSDDDEI